MVSVAQVEAAGGYSIVLADPAWGYRDKGIRGGIGRKYSGMRTDAVCALPVSRIAAPNAWLFLWATWPMLPDAFEVIRAWGFEYKTLAFLWVKLTQGGRPSMGNGHYTRANSEPCLLATRGRLDRLDKGVSQVIAELEDEPVLLAQRGEHSAKPPAARERIIKLVGDLPAIELFARERVDGFDCWGDDPRIGEPDVDLGGDHASAEGQGEGDPELGLGGSPCANG